MPLSKGCSKKTFQKNLKLLLKEGRPMKQALAICYSLQDKCPKKGLSTGRKKITYEPPPPPPARKKLTYEPPPAYEDAPDTVRTRKKLVYCPDCDGTGINAFGDKCWTCGASGRMGRSAGTTRPPLDPALDAHWRARGIDLKQSIMRARARTINKRVAETQAGRRAAIEHLYRAYNDAIARHDYASAKEFARALEAERRGISTVDWDLPMIPVRGMASGRSKKKASKKKASPRKRRKSS